jgi:hypothetical protein
MKDLFRIKCIGTIRSLLLTVMITFCLPIVADNWWVMIFQDAYGMEQQIPMENVGSLVAVDDAYDFTILSTSGDILAEGVLKVSFQANGSTGIKPIKSSGNMIARIASDKLILIGANGEIAIYNTAGSLQTRMKATGGETIVSIAHLPSGVYIVKTGTQTFKFMKK